MSCRSLLLAGALALALAPSALACPPAGRLGCNATVTGTTSGGALSPPRTACLGGDLAGPEASYELVLTAPARVALVLDDAADASLELLLLSACDATDCLRRHGDRIVADLAAGTYVVVVDGPGPGGAPFTLALTCGSGLLPALAEFAGAAGDCFSESKVGWMTPGAPQVDVLLALDVSGSMGQELAALQAQLPQLMDAVGSSVQDAAFGLVSFVDYHFEGSGTSECWYSGPNYGRDTDYPYRLDRAMTTDRAAVDAALAALVTLDGLDLSEPYTRALHEAVADGRLAWRPGARRVLVTFGDELMHACNPLECLGDVSRFPRGPDFGRDGVPDTADDLQLLPTVDALAAAGITWLHVDSSGGRLETAGDGSRGYRYAEVFACLTARTGGAVHAVAEDATTSTGETLGAFVGRAVQDALARCGDLRLEAEPGREAWLADAGAAFADVALPATRPFEIRTCIPDGTPAGSYEFEVRLTCEGSVVAAQVVRIQVGEGDCAAPAPFFARAEDLSTCSSGVRVAWDRVAWPDPARPGVIHVRRGVAGCADAGSRPPVVTMLPGSATSWIDRVPPGGPLTYVVEAEVPGSAAGCAQAGWGGGAATTACAGPIVDEGLAEFPAGVGATLRMRHAGDAVTVDWTLARPLLAGEHAHLLKAWDSPTSPFLRVTPEAFTERTHGEADRTSPLQFFDLRVANACEDQSLDDFPPGWDGHR